MCVRVCVCVRVYVIKSEKKNSSEPAKTGEVEVIIPTISDIQSHLNIPIFSLTAETTGITESVYDLEIEQFIKNIREYKTQLFKDKDQYIIDTNFIFEIDVNEELFDYNIIDEDGKVSKNDYNSPMTAMTENSGSTIDRGTFKGLNFKSGDYFSFFEIPDKPKLEYPTPEGKIETFTPEIFWTNGEGADEYVVQVNYNTGDTNFTGTVFTYIIPKNEKSKEASLSKTKDSESEFSTNKTIRKYQISLKTNKSLIYRVGNVKFLKNIFDVKQSVITFSDSKSIYTQIESMENFVKIENDSPWIEDISGLQNPTSINFNEYSLSGVVSGSIVSGATMQLIYPDSSFVMLNTNSIGEFTFGTLRDGTYTLNTVYRGYAADSRQIILNEDKSVSIDLEIMWDNVYENWAFKESDIIKY